MLTRRTTLRSSLAALAVPVAGCERAARFRAIYIDNLSITDKAEMYSISGEIDVESQGSSEDWRTFHNVSVVAYTDRREQVCEIELENLDGGKRNIEFSTQCNRFPHRIVIEADETPCQSDTTVHEYVYTGQSGGQRIWEEQERVCE